MNEWKSLGLRVLEFDRDYSAYRTTIGILSFILCYPEVSGLDDLGTSSLSGHAPKQALHNSCQIRTPAGYMILGGFSLGALPKPSYSMYTTPKGPRTNKIIGL